MSTDREKWRIEKEIMLDVVANIGCSSSVFASNVDYKDGDDDDDDDMVTWMLDGVVGLGIHFQY